MMSALRYVPWCLAVGLAGCFDPSTDLGGGAESTGATDDATGPSTTAPITTEGATSQSMTSGPDTTAGPPDTGSDTTDVGDTTNTVGESTDTGTGSTGEVPLLCGDGIVAPGELCFDDATAVTANDVTYSPRLGDVTGDDIPDLVYLIGDQIVIRFGAGDGTFGNPVFDETIFGTDAELVDVDNDGALDVVYILDYANELSVAFGNGAGSFTATGMPLTTAAEPVALAMGLMSNDNLPDAIVVSGIANPTLVQVFSAGTAAGFSSPATATLSAGGSVREVAVGEFSGDGNLDVVYTIATASNQVRVRFGDGAGGLGSSVNVSVDAPDARGVAAGDFDGDGDSDIAVANGAQILTLVGTGAGGFAAVVTLTAAGTTNVVAAVDLTSDGLDDVIAAYSDTQLVSLWPSHGDGTFGERVDIGIGAPTTSLSTGNANDDGVPDIVVGDTNTQLVTVLLSTP